MADGVQDPGLRGGQDRSCRLPQAPSRRNFDVSAFHRTLYSIGKRFRPILVVLKFHSMGNFIAFSARAPSDRISATHKISGGLGVFLIVLYTSERVCSCSFFCSAGHVHVGN